jgi:uncharacterized protein
MIKVNMNQNIEFLILYDKLSEFVKYITKDRDESHGYQHMKKVCFNSLQILNEESKNINLKDLNDIFKDVMIVSWLHDVADHKYDWDGILKLKVENFLNNISNKVLLLMNIIDRISYSKEDEALKSNSKLDWDEVLGDYGCIIRNIVSDADKLEALGKIGFERCVEYGKISYKKKYGNDMPNNILIYEVKKHANEKLLRLKDEFIHTSYGKSLAEKMHDELIVELNKMQ